MPIVERPAWSGIPGTQSSYILGVSARARLASRPGKIPHRSPLRAMPSPAPAHTVKSKTHGQPHRVEPAAVGPGQRHGRTNRTHPPAPAGHRRRATRRRLSGLAAEQEATMNSETPVVTAPTGPARVLVLGSGVTGCVDGGRLLQAGHHVVMLARGQRLADLRGPRACPGGRPVRAPDTAAGAGGRGAARGRAL